MAKESGEIQEVGVERGCGVKKGERKSEKGERRETNINCWVFSIGKFGVKIRGVNLVPILGFWLKPGTGTETGVPGYCILVTGYFG